MLGLKFSHSMRSKGTVTPYAHCYMHTPDWSITKYTSPEITILLGKEAIVMVRDL